MDLSQPVTYRGLTLNAAEGGPGGDNPVEGIRLVRAQYSDVSVHGYTEKKSLSDGMDASDVFMGQRQVVLKGEVYAAERASLFDRLDALRLKFTPTDAYAEDPRKYGYLPLAFQVPTLHTAYWPTGFSDRVLYCRPSSQPDHAIEFIAQGRADGQGYVVPFDITLEAKDPRFYHPVAKEGALDGLSGSGDFTNRGNYPAPLSFVLQPADDTGGIFHFSGVGSTFDVDIPAGTGTRYVIVDSINKVVTYTEDGTENLRMDIIEFLAGTTWPEVPPIPEGESAAGWTWSSVVPLTAPPSRTTFNEAWA